MGWKAVSYISRALFALLILAAAVQGRSGAVVFNGLIFLVTLVVPFLARRNRAFYPLDAALMLLFILPLLATFFGYVMHATWLGEDKLFHAAGGALLAWFAAIAFGPHVRSAFALALTAVFFAVAVGAWWEIYEWILLLLENEYMRLTLADSLLDIIADTAGALAVAALVYKKKKN